MKKTLSKADTDQYPNSRRRSVRYRITGSVCFHWRAEDGHWYEARGCTCNISKAGAFIESDNLPPLGSAVKLVATLPIGWRSDRPLSLSGAGDVRHVRQGACHASGYGASVVFRMEVPMPTA